MAEEFGESEGGGREEVELWVAVAVGAWVRRGGWGVGGAGDAEPDAREGGGGRVE